MCACVSVCVCALNNDPFVLRSTHMAYTVSVVSLAYSYPRLTRLRSLSFEQFLINPSKQELDPSVQEFEVLHVSQIKQG